MRKPGVLPVSLAVGVLLLTACATESSSGPLMEEGRYLSYYLVPPPGSRFSEGFQMMEVEGKQSVTVDSVEVKGGDAALDFLGARIGLPGRPDDFNQLMKGYPPAAVPTRFQVPAEGAVLEPGAIYMLIIGYRVRKRVLDLRTGIAVHYHMGGQEYVRDYPAGLAVCPPSLTYDECGEEGTGFDLEDLGPPELDDDLDPGEPIEIRPPKK